MKITTISKVASLVISSVMIQTAVAGHAVGIGVGPRFGGGGFGGGIFEMFLAAAVSIRRLHLVAVLASLSAPVRQLDSQ